MKTGEDHLLAELRSCGLEWCDIEAVEIGGEPPQSYNKVAKEHRGLFTGEEALPILRQYTLDHESSWWRVNALPDAFVTVWTKEFIFYTHEYDTQISLTYVSRNPPRE